MQCLATQVESQDDLSYSNPITRLQNMLLLVVKCLVIDIGGIPWIEAFDKKLSSFF